MFLYKGGSPSEQGPRPSLLFGLGSSSPVHNIIIVNHNTTIIVRISSTMEVARQGTQKLKVDWIQLRKLVLMEQFRLFRLEDEDNHDEDEVEDNHDEDEV